MDFNLGFGGKAKSLRSSSHAGAIQGNRLRDEGKLVEAAEAYAEYLAKYPTAFAIWVQRGNCLKDAGLFLPAKDAYERAIDLNGADPDVHLQLGHLLKINGRVNDAIVAYRRSHELDPARGLAAIELKALHRKPDASFSPLRDAELSGPVVLIDVSDLIAYLKENLRVTGIQRVQSCIIQRCVASRAVIARGFALKGIVFCCCDQLNGTVHALPIVKLSELVDSAQSGECTAAELNEKIEALLTSKIQIEPRKRDTYIILGAFWLGDGYTRTLLKLKKAQVNIGVYVYDLIPLTHPQFVADSTRTEVVERFGDIMSLADFVLTISDFVAREVRSTIEFELDREIPIHSVPLAHELPETSTQPVDPDFEASLPEEFALCVCTLEGRKNHLLLLKAWRSLYRKHGRKLPALVLVGKWGWRIEEFRNRLEQEGYVDGKIIVLGNLTDSQIRVLYQRSLLTLFPSFAEGWGLPVGESLAYGKPCIASNTTSIPEVGGRFCRYIDPSDAVAAAAEIERALFDRQDLARWTQDIASGFRMRSWQQVADDFFAKTELALKQVQEGRVRLPVSIRPGHVHLLNPPSIDATPADNWRAAASRFLCIEGWGDLEPRGMLATSSKAEILFGTPLSTGTRLRLFCLLALPRAEDRCAIRWENVVDGPAGSVALYGQDPRYVVMEAVVDADQNVSLKIERLGNMQIKKSKRRPSVCFIFKGLAYHVQDDPAGRLDLLESLTLNLHGGPGPMVFVNGR